MATSNYTTSSEAITSEGASCRLNDVAIVRLLAIFLVVLFHALHMLMDGTHLQDSTEIYRSTYLTLNGIINSFNMPLFIFISGYLFSYLENDKMKYQSSKELIITKIKRLLMPFFVFTSLIMVSFRDFSIEPFLTWSYCHLWFIPMLFWCFVFTRALSLLPFSHHIIAAYSLLSLSCLATVTPLNIPNYFGLNNFVRWYFWFYLGYKIYLTRDMLLDFYIKHTQITIASLLILFGFGVLIQNIQPDGNKFYCLISIPSMVLLIWGIVNTFLINHLIGEKFIRIFNSLNKYCFGIYIFHYWLQPILIGSTLTSVFSLDIMAKNHIVLFPCLYVLISLGLSLGITWAFLKTKVGRFLIG